VVVVWPEHRDGDWDLSLRRYDPDAGSWTDARPLTRRPGNHADVVLATALGAAGAAVILQPPVTDEHRSRVDALADEARDAAARSYFVYPSSDDDDAVTAYRKVLELEALEGPAERLADERAAQLRQELAQTLRRLGDRFYEREGGRAFAADYYAAALVFDPDDEHARSRTSLTPGEVAQLRSRAADGSFAPAELAAAASLAVLAVEDDDERRERLVALYASDQAPSPTTSARIEALVGERDTEAIARAVQPRRRARAKGTAEAADANTPEPEPEPEPEPSGVEDDAGEPAATADRRDPGKARELANKGIAAFERGDFTTAESLLHRALGHDRRNAAALGGLAELYFERGSYQKASQYAAKAVSAAPRSGKYRIVLGDAHFKSLSYASARREYEKARSLGHPKAAGRLALLDKRLGE
ncbi:MAG: tetratricopeptide repeat protein, partial [Nannocystaceae bacterium]